MRDTVRGRRNSPCLADRMGGGPRGGDVGPGSRSWRREPRHAAAG